MTGLFVLELERVQVEAARQVLARPVEPLEAKEAFEVLDYLMEAAERLYRIADLPVSVLQAEGGMEASCLEQVCQAVIGVINRHLELLDVAREKALHAAAREKVALPRMAHLEVHRDHLFQLVVATEKIVELIKKEPSPFVHWDKVRQGQEEIARGEFISYPSNIHLR
jgi:hypothetical protein